MSLALPIVLILICMVIGALYLGGVNLTSGVNLTRLGIGFEVLGGIWAAPDVIVFILGKDRIESYSTKLYDFVNSTSEALSSRRKTFGELLSYRRVSFESLKSSLFPHERKHDDLVSLFKDLFRVFIHIAGTYILTAATGLYLVVIPLYWLATKNVLTTIVLAVSILILSTVVQIIYVIIIPLLAKRFYKISGFLSIYTLVPLVPALLVFVALSCLWEALI